MKALVLSTFANGEPLDLPLANESGQVISARTLVAHTDDVAVYLVSSTAEQIAVLPKRQGIYAVGPGAWDTEMDAATATVINGLLSAGGYAALSVKTTYLDGMRAVFGPQFDGALYNCYETEAPIEIIEEWAKPPRLDWHADPVVGASTLAAVPVPPKRRRGKACPSS